MAGKANLFGDYNLHTRQPGCQYPMKIRLCGSRMHYIGLYAAKPPIKDENIEKVHHRRITIENVYLEAFRFEILLRIPPSAYRSKYILIQQSILDIGKGDILLLLPPE